MDKKQIIPIIQDVLFEYTSAELFELMHDLELADDPLLYFCNRFGLGDWFNDQMIGADIDIIYETSKIADAHRDAENDDYTLYIEQEDARRGL